MIVSTVLDVLEMIENEVAAEYGDDDENNKTVEIQDILY